MISATMFTDLDQTYSLSEEIEDKVLVSPIQYFKIETDRQNDDMAVSDADNEEWS